MDFIPFHTLPRMWMVPEGKGTSKTFRVADAQRKIKSEECSPERVSISFRHLLFINSLNFYTNLELLCHCNAFG